ncbi:MAG: hypothetical protein M1833_004608 [Piccolia ochrophora]|nr:MAG: hypothetical protein M1833_004608 [Piccolia ochrophora]
MGEYKTSLNLAHLGPAKRSAWNSTKGETSRTKSDSYITHHNSAGAGVANLRYQQSTTSLGSGRRSGGSQRSDASLKRSLGRAARKYLRVSDSGPDYEEEQSTQSSKAGRRSFISKLFLQDKALEKSKAHETQEKELPKANDRSVGDMESPQQHLATGVESNDRPRTWPQQDTVNQSNLKMSPTETRPKREDDGGSRFRGIRAAHAPPLSRTDTSTSSTSSTASKTKKMLNAVSGLLRTSEKAKHRAFSLVSSKLGSLEDSSANPRRHLAAPQRSATMISASSSVLELMMGTPPTTTPNTEAMYGGSRHADYFKVEISDSRCPSFLPSEATRVHTPRLLAEDRKMGRHGSPWLYSSPNSPLWDSERSNASPPPALRALEDDDDSIRSEWLAPDGKDASVFELQVPQHLPGSPLCPISKLHKSGGKGVCLYHGRRPWPRSRQSSG